MTLYINGEKHELEVVTLADVVSHFQLDANLIVTEVDGKIIDREDWERTEVKNGMSIELVHFVGGG